MAKNWSATIFDQNRIIQARITPKGKLEELTKDFERCVQADSWAARRLTEGASDWFAVISHATLHLSTILTRDDAMGQVLGSRRAGPVTHSQHGSSKNIGFGCGKASQTRVTFSHG